MHILFLLTQDLSSPSGIGRYLPMATGLARLGHRVEISALHPDSENLAEPSLDVEGVSVRYVAPMHVRKTGSGKEYYPLPKLLAIAAVASVKLLSSALRSRPDLIVVGKPQPMNGIAGYLASRRLRVPLVVDCDDYEAASGRFEHGFQTRIVSMFENWLPKRANCVTTNTQFNLRRMHSNGVPRDRLRYISNGVEERRFAVRNPDGARALREQLGLEDSFVVGYIGSLSSPSHPVEILLAAIMTIRPENPKVKLLIVGGGEDFHAISQAVREQGLETTVVLAGRVASSQVPLYYQASDVIVEPIYDDDAARGRSPLKLFESLVSGVPFVTSDVGDRKQLAGDPPAVLFVDPGDPAAMARGILTLLDNPEHSGELVERGSRQVSSYFWRHIVPEFEAALLSCASRSTIKADR